MNILLRVWVSIVLNWKLNGLLRHRSKFNEWISLPGAKVYVRFGKMYFDDEGF